MCYQDALPDDMLSAALRGVVDDAGIAPLQVHDICIGIAITIIVHHNSLLKEKATSDIFN